MKDSKSFTAGSLILRDSGGSSCDVSLNNSLWNSGNDPLLQTQCVHNVNMEEKGGSREGGREWKREQGEGQDEMRVHVIWKEYMRRKEEGGRMEDKKGRG